MCQMCEEYEAELRRMGIAMDEVKTNTGHDKFRAIINANVSNHRTSPETTIARPQPPHLSLPPLTTDGLTLLRDDSSR
jgi:hypothetical protein